MISIHIHLRNGEIASLSYNMSQIMVQNEGMDLKIVYNGVEIIFDIS